MKIFRSLLIALAMLSLIACGDDGGSLNGEDLVDSGVEDDAAVKPPPGDDEDEDGGDPGDGDPGDGDPGDDDDDDDGQGPDEPTDPDITATLSFVVVDEESQPYVGATVRILGHEIEPEISDADGRVEFEVPRLGEYQALIEGMGDDWSVAHPVLVDEERTRPEAVIAYSAQAIGSIGEDTGVSLSEDDGLILFTIQASVIGGQSVQLPYGEPFVQVSPDESSDEAILIAGSTLLEDGYSFILYVNVPPSALSPAYAGGAPNESCDALFTPPNGWSSLAKTLVMIPVVCQPAGD